MSLLIYLTLSKYTYTVYFTIIHSKLTNKRIVFISKYNLKVIHSKLTETKLHKIYNIVYDIPNMLKVV